ncbi:hypothetical protein ACFYUV_45855 [Nonomuraea sp. NPDC003560]|uniref:hypothetical protein n=1 Tax=Nonomuraea sp. NPDC003560 TaxID=3364341 RepID=UPI0036C77A1E
MDLETRILKLLLRLRKHKAGRPAGDLTATTAGITRMQADIADIRTEMRQDFAALGDELAALRRHMNDHFTSSRPRCCKDPEPGCPQGTQAYGPDPINN